MPVIVLLHWKVIVGLLPDIVRSRVVTGRSRWWIWYVWTAGDRNWVSSLFHTLPYLLPLLVGMIVFSLLYWLIVRLADSDTDIVLAVFEFAWSAFSRAFNFFDFGFVF